MYRQSSTPDIFDLNLWRHIIFGNHGNRTLCTIPDQYRSITDAYCRAHNKPDCLQLPCTLIYLSSEFNETVQCLRGGKVAVNENPDWICRTSPALELFANPQRRPSIRAEAYTSITSELYGQALAPFRDPEKTRWGLTLEGESIGYYPSVAEKKRVLPLFDITVGYDRRYFDLINDVHLTDYVDSITNRNHQRLSIPQVLRGKVRGRFVVFCPMRRKRLAHLDRAPILWINGNCDTPSNRTGYMLELMRYIRVDALGKCGNPSWNRTFISSDPKALAKEKMTLAQEYLFTVAIENSLEYDYVTEKLWQPLAAGSVPLYLGAPNIDEWLPCSNYSCIVHLRDFPTVRDAALFIDGLVENQKQYMQYHLWRRDLRVRTSFLKMVNYFEEANKHSIECLLCDMVHRNDHGTMRRRLLAANNPFNDTFPSLI